MPAETLLGEVEERQKKALEELESDYAARKAELVKNTTDEIASMKESAKKDALALCERERARISGVANLQAKKMVLDASEKMIESNLLALKEVLASYAESKEYPGLLLRMAKYATARLGASVGVVCRRSDTAILKQAGVKIISSDLNSIGGFKAKSDDGNLELDLTFEEILRIHDEEARTYILGKG